MSTEDYWKHWQERYISSDLRRVERTKLIANCISGNIILLCITAIIIVIILH